MNDLFRKISKWTSRVTGSPAAFIVSATFIFFWAITGPLFHFSDSWQLVVNTATTVLTFLMVFLIQNTQNRDAHAIHLKLDEIIRAIKPARNELIDVEEDDDTTISTLQKEFKDLRETVHSHIASKKEAEGSTES